MDKEKGDKKITTKHFPDKLLMLVLNFSCQLNWLKKE